MSNLKISLFGKFVANCDGLAPVKIEGLKLQELFSYLLLYRNRYLLRETLADLIWRDCNSEKPKKYLRQALWHLQMILESHVEETHEPMLLVEHDWVRINTKAAFWLDVAVFEQASDKARGKSGSELSASLAQEVEAAVKLYTGDLLEGCYQDWCLFERERLQNMYLVMLDKLIGYCIATHRYEAGLEYGTLVLAQDQAHERTHRQMMLLQYQAGNRSAALRQYERCAFMLKKELDVEPDSRTVALYQQIRDDRLSHAMTVGPEPSPQSTAPNVLLPEVLEQLKRLQSTLCNTERELQQKIKIVEVALSHRH